MVHHQKPVCYTYAGTFSMAFADRMVVVTDNVKTAPQAWGAVYSGRMLSSVID